MGFIDFGEGSGLEFALDENDYESDCIEDSNTIPMAAADECKTVCGEHIFTVATFILVIIILLLLLFYSFTASVR